MALRSCFSSRSSPLRTPFLARGRCSGALFPSPFRSGFSRKRWRRWGSSRESWLPWLPVAIVARGGGRSERGCCGLRWDASLAGEQLRQVLTSMSPLCLGAPTHPGSGVRQPRGIRPLCQGAGPVLPYPSPREDSDPLSPGRPLPPEQRPCPGWEPPASRNSRPSSAVSWGKRRLGGSREVGGLGSGGSPGGECVRGV